MTDRLRTFLKDKRGDASLRDFAYSLGISHTYLDSLEKGVNPKTGAKVSVSAETIKKIADHFGVQTDYLLGRVDSPTDSLVPEKKQTSEDITGENLSDPVLDEIADNLKRMSPEEREAVRRLTQSVANRETKSCRISQRDKILWMMCQRMIKGGCQNERPDQKAPGTRPPRSRE